MISFHEPSKRLCPTVTYHSRIGALLGFLLGVSAAKLITGIHALITNLIACAIIPFKRFDRPFVLRIMLL